MSYKSFKDTNQFDIDNEDKSTNKNTEKESNKDLDNSQDSLLFIKRDKNEIIEEANKIIKERSKNRGLSLTNRPKGKHAFITDTRDVCLKNYLIGLLKEERTVLSDKELKIQEALLSSEKRLTEDTKYFLDYVEREKESIKTKEEKIIKQTAENKNLTDKLNELKKERKTLIDDSERCIKNITNLKAISVFVHKLLGIRNINSSNLNLFAGNNSKSTSKKNVNINIDNYANNKDFYNNSNKKNNNNDNDNDIINDYDYDNNPLDGNMSFNSMKNENLMNNNNINSNNSNNNNNINKQVSNFHHHNNNNNNNNNSNNNNYSSVTNVNSNLSKNFESKEKIIERSSNQIIDEFKRMNINSTKNKEILSDYKRLITKFTETEEKILKLMEKKEEYEKDYSRITERHQQEIRILEEHEKSVTIEKKKLQTELMKDEKSLNQLKGQSSDGGDKKKHTRLLMELYKESVMIEQPKKRVLDNNYSKPLMDYLREKENKIREYIYLLESYNPELVIVHAEKRKMDNKEKTRNFIKQKKERENEERNHKARERMNRIFIKGRNVMTHFKPKEDKVVTKETTQKQINQNNILFYDSDL